jgi:oxygen-independent coproporphyrinogen-3 oxidase
MVEADVDAYFQALLVEIASYRKEPPVKLRTVYVGGGTPSLAGPERSRMLLRAVHAAFDCSSLEEFTVEANPESADTGMVDVWKEFGVNRVSLGVQSFDNRTLARWNRPTRKAHILEAFRLLKSAAVGAVGLDLILGIQDPLDLFIEDLEQAVHFRPEHISVYLLELPERFRADQTPAAAETADRGLGDGVSSGFDCGHDDVSSGGLDDEKYERLYFETACRLSSCGYRHYEVSNFAQPGRESLHNLNYWRGGSYIGVGLGAVSTLGNLRTQNTGNLESYVKDLSFGRPPVRQTEELSSGTLRFERVMLGLRTIEGIDFESLQPDWKARQYVDLLVESGFGVLEAGRLSLTAAGYFRSSTIIADFSSLVSNYLK